jgi:hypothetical protein
MFSVVLKFGTGGTGKTVSQTVSTPHMLKREGSQELCVGCRKTSWLPGRQTKDLEPIST